MTSPMQAIIFDLDGVITDTAEYHYLAWKKLADEEGIPFNRLENEALRGVSRRDSLSLILKGTPISDTRASDLMERKNGYYLDLLTGITPNDLLAGVAGLLKELRSAGIKIAIASASRNAPEVISRLGIQDQIDVLAHGGSVARQKPAPDLFLYAARQLGIPPGECLVVEDAKAGIQAARTAGMITVGLGPTERVGAADLVLPDLSSACLEVLLRAAAWRVSEPSFQPEKQRHRETIFTHGNGYLSTRGTFEERYPGDSQATLLHGIWDDVPVSFTELANAPDWAALEIEADGKRFKMQASQIQDYSRFLDLRSGILYRRLEWSPEPGCRLQLDFERFASLDDEHLAALRLQVTVLEGRAQIRIRSLLDSHVENQGLLHWHSIGQHSAPTAASIIVETRYTRKRVALSTQLNFQPASVQAAALDCPGCPGMVLEASLEKDASICVEKITAIYTSRDTDDPLKAAHVKAGQASKEGFEKLKKAQTAAWKNFWDTSDVYIEGDLEAQIAIRHALFQLRIAAPTHDEHASIGAKTLSGFGYRGHVFWDNEIFVLPFFSCTQPQIARNMLMYRYHSMPGARRKAAGNGFAGAQFPWESAESGDEVTPTWVPHFADPTKLVRIWTGDIQIHISADIAYAMYQYWLFTGDDEFWRQVGIPVLLETAVFWGERAKPEGQRFAIRDVIGPDENHDHVDNNQFTNYMVRWHLQTALDALEWLQEKDADRFTSLTAELDLSPGRLAHWQRVIDGIILLHNPKTGLIEQFEGFYALKDVDWPAFTGRTQSMQEILGIEGCTQYKALKQADVIGLLCLLGDQFDQATWQANWDYYEPITDHEYGSSLGPAMHAWAACRLNQPEKAYEHYMRAARADLRDIRGNADDGIHAASAGGQWEALVFGFAGMRLGENGLQFNPTFPAHWKRVSFNIIYRGKKYHFDFQQSEEK